jgi:hypothetical protein
VAAGLVISAHAGEPATAVPVSQQRALAAHELARPEAPAALSAPYGPAAAAAKPKKDCEFWDVGCMVSQGVNQWFKDLSKSAIKAVFHGMGKQLLRTPEVQDYPRLVEISGQTRWIANTCMVLLVMAGGFLLMGHETLQTSYTVKDLAPRLVVAVITCNFSNTVVGEAIGVANALAAGVLGPGVDVDLAMKTLEKRLSVPSGDGVDFIIFLILAAAVMGAVLVVIFALRITLTMLLVAAGPLALACHALPQTEELARLWWRALAGLLGVQVAQALVFIVAVKVLLTPNGTNGFAIGTNLTDIVLVLCLLYVLIRIPSWIAYQVMTGGLRRSPLARIPRYVMYRHLITSAVGGRGRRGP